MLVWTCTPVVTQVIKKFDLAVEVVGEAGGETFSKHNKWVYGARKCALQEDHAWVSQRNTKQDDKVLDTRRQVANGIKETLVGGLTANLIDLALGSAISKQDPLLGPKVSQQTMVAERNVLSITTNNHTPVRMRGLADTINLVVNEKLEEEEEEVSSAANVVENRCTHELVRISAETVDQVVVVKHVNHGDLCDGLGERATAEPFAVVVEHVSVDAIADFVGQRVSHTLLRVGLVVPVLHLGLTDELVTVDLITAANEGMVWLGGVRLEQVVPERVGAVEIGLVDAGTEAVATVTSPSEVLRLGGKEEGVSSHTLDSLGLRGGMRLAIDRVVHSELVISQRNLDLETPESERALSAVVLVELDGLRLLARVVLRDSGGAICGGCREGRSFLPPELHVGCDRVVTGSILGDDHGKSMVDVLVEIDGVISEHRPRLDVESRHLCRIL